MTTGRASVLAIGAIAVFGLGVVAGPYFMGDARRDNPDVSQEATAGLPPPVEAAPSTATRRPGAPRQG